MNAIRTRPGRPSRCIGWTGMRGIVSLALALALPLALPNGTPFPQRAVVVVVSFAVILATLVAAGADPAGDHQGAQAEGRRRRPARGARGAAARQRSRGEAPHRDRRHLDHQPAADGSRPPPLRAAPGTADRTDARRSRVPPDRGRRAPRSAACAARRWTPSARRSLPCATRAASAKRSCTACRRRWISRRCSRIVERSQK